MTLKVAKDIGLSQQFGSEVACGKHNMYSYQNVADY